MVFERGEPIHIQPARRIQYLDADETPVLANVDDDVVRDVAVHHLLASFVQAEIEQIVLTVIFNADRLADLLSVPPGD